MLASTSRKSFDKSFSNMSVSVGNILADTSTGSHINITHDLEETDELISNSQRASNVIAPSTSSASGILSKGIKKKSKGIVYQIYLLLMILQNILKTMN